VQLDEPVDGAPAQSLALDPAIEAPSLVVPQELANLGEFPAGLDHVGETLAHEALRLVEALLDRDTLSGIIVLEYLAEIGLYGHFYSYCLIKNRGGRDASALCAI
jgi:hypothetical protein